VSAASSRVCCSPVQSGSRCYCSSLQLPSWHRASRLLAYISAGTSGLSVPPSASSAAPPCPAVAMAQQPLPPIHLFESATPGADGKPGSTIEDWDSSVQHEVRRYQALPGGTPTVHPAVRHGAARQQARSTSKLCRKHEAAWLKDHADGYTHRLLCRQPPCWWWCHLGVHWPGVRQDPRCCAVHHAAVGAQIMQQPPLRHCR
jgi:hypothetical protein